MAENNTKSFIRIENLRFGWTPNETFLVVQDWSIEAGEHVFLEGPSGSGKSTLLGLISGVLRPNSGSIFVDGINIATLSDSKRDAVRADQMGVIFQLFNLIPYLSVLDNVTLPCKFSKKRRQHALTNCATLSDEARRLLNALDLQDDEILNRSVTDLSVGQQQRVAAARALIGGPDLIIADEPTSALDTPLRDRFIDLLKQEARQSNTTLLFVSHDQHIAAHFQRKESLLSLNSAAMETA